VAASTSDVSKPRSHLPNMSHPLGRASISQQSRWQQRDEPV
jgi:hypothetical protein